MDKYTLRLAILASALILGCSAAPQPTPPPPSPAATLASLAPVETVAPTVAPTAIPAPTLVATPTPVVTPSPQPQSACIPSEGELAVTIDSKSNIFAAGRSIPPAPGGGGAGVVPVLVDLPATDPVEVIFPCVDGQIDCCARSPNSRMVGPAGDLRWSTDIESHNGLSGIINGDSGVFLVGVFLSDQLPEDPAPDRLDFTGLCDPTCSFARFEPALNQVFYVGAGGEEHAYIAPAGATRLYLGFADAFLVKGEPGWYSNNEGELTALVRLP